MSVWDLEVPHVLLPRCVVFTFVLRLLRNAISGPAFAEPWSLAIVRLLVLAPRFLSILWTANAGDSKTAQNLPRLCHLAMPPMPPRRRGIQRLQTLKAGDGRIARAGKWRSFLTRSTY